MTTSRIWSVTTWWQWVPRPWPHGLSGRERPKEGSVLERWGWCNGVITLWEPRGASPSLTLGWGLDTPGVSTSEFHGSTAFVFISENWEWSSKDQRSLFQPFIWLLSKQIPKAKSMTQQDKACLSSVGDPVRPCRNERHSWRGTHAVEAAVASSSRAYHSLTSGKDMLGKGLGAFLYKQVMLIG